MKFGVVVLPGSNCDHDALHVAKDVLGAGAEVLWHKDTELKGADCVIIPGGFAYGDYLRAGALAKFAPIMALMRNQHVRFLSRDVHLRTEETDTPFTSLMTAGQVFAVPIAHGEGNYFADDATLDELELNRQVIFRYSDEEGRLTAEANPNGSARHIAGICNRQRNVLGMMPHPERCAESILGNAAGLQIFQSIAASFAMA
jgi:phosphoribosylformylglycinamidine (FGAM) synthase-like amidotransferase family enzyme